MLQRLNAIVDVETAVRFGWSPIDLARAFLDGGARFLQLRAKPLSSGALFEMAEGMSALGRQRNAILIVNDRADVAAAARANGVHVGQEDLAPAAVRRILGEAATIGLSTHNEPQLRAGSLEPVDYLAIGPVFSTVTKATGYDAVGLDMVRRAVLTRLPVVAIGGITLENAKSVIDAGAASVAVITDLLSTGDPEGRVRQYLTLLA